MFREQPVVGCGCTTGYLLGSSQFAVLKDLNFIPEVAALEHKLAQSCGSGPEHSLFIVERGRSHYRCQGGRNQTYASVQAFWKHSGERTNQSQTQNVFFFVDSQTIAGRANLPSCFLESVNHLTTLDFA